MSWQPSKVSTPAEHRALLLAVIGGVLEGQVSVANLWEGAG
jgi:hypothetical protein